MCQLRHKLHLNALGFSEADWQQYEAHAHDTLEDRKDLTTAGKIAADAPDSLAWDEDWCPLLCMKMIENGEMVGRLFKPQERLYPLCRKQFRQYLLNTRMTEYRVERCPDKVLNSGCTTPIPGQELLQVVHATLLRQSFSPHSTPFLMWVCPDDTVHDVREKIRLRLRVRTEEIRRWRLWAQFQHTQDTMDVSLNDEANANNPLFQFLSRYDPQGPISMENGWRLILEHPDPERSEPPEKALRIDAL
jgi:hypothetical protein